MGSAPRVARRIDSIVMFPPQMWTHVHIPLLNVIKLRNGFPVIL